jgi:hypothetical protein
LVAKTFDLVAMILDFDLVLKKKFNLDYIFWTKCVRAIDTLWRHPFLVPRLCDLDLKLWHLFGVTFPGELCCLLKTLVEYFPFRWYDWLLNIFQLRNCSGSCKQTNKQSGVRSLVFSSSELKAQVSYSDCPLSVVCLFVCPSVCKLLHFRLLLQNHRANFNQTRRKSSLGGGDSKLFKWRGLLFSKGR